MTLFIQYLFFWQLELCYEIANGKNVLFYHGEDSSNSNDYSWGLNRSRVSDCYTADYYNSKSNDLRFIITKRGHAFA